MAILAAAAALAMSPAAAATVQGAFEGPVFSPDSVGTVTEGGTQWNFGVPIRSRPGGDAFADRRGMNGGHSTVTLTGSSACEAVAALSECLVGTIRYNNRVNVGAGSGAFDTATARFSGTQWNFDIALNISIDRSTNGSCAGIPFGCPDQWFVNFTSPLDGFRIAGSGGTVDEEGFADISIFWIRPAENPEVDDPEDEPEVPVVPLPASALFLGAGVAALAAVRRRRARG